MGGEESKDGGHRKGKVKTHEDDWDADDDPDTEDDGMVAEEDAWCVWWCPQRKQSRSAGVEGPKCVT